MKVFLIAGARPNFMKIAPIVRALRARNEVEKVGSYEAKTLFSNQRNQRNNTNQINYKIIHTGQHYDREMSEAFFDDLEIPKPAYHLEAGSGTHAEQTAKIMIAFEKVCEQEKPDIVVVVGDVNSTLACSIVAKKALIKVAHVEAGLRSFDLTMPEEINRMVTDAITDYFFVTEESGVQNLIREGKPAEQVHFVGHVMIDNLFHQLEKQKRIDPTGLSVYDLKKNNERYAFLTLHRPSNVDNRETFQDIVDALNEISKDLPIFFPVHPRTNKQLNLLPFTFYLSPSIHLLPPLNFTESLFLWKDAEVVLTDSGGLQEETTALGVPCVTIRDNTERPITVSLGTNVLAGTKKEGILDAYRQCFAKAKTASVPPLWDGKAAERIVEILVKQ